jgi:hypothetical protein
MDNKKTKEVTDLNPKSSDYADKIKAARGIRHPVGGADMPKMPNFAEMQTQDRYAGVQSQRTQGMATLLTAEQQEQLQKEGKLIPGVGSAYAVNQPAAANAPAGYQNPPRPAGSKLSPDTVEQLKAVAEANNQRGQTVSTGSSPDPEKMKQDIDEVEEDLVEGFDIDEFGNKVRSLLANKERREAIESRCDPMDLMDLLVNKEVRQVVPVVPGKYEPEFRSSGGDEDLYVKRRLSSERGSTEFILSKMTLMNLTCGLYSINGKPLPTHFTADGDIDDEAFTVKFKLIVKYPMPLLADLAVNYSWFDKRVRKLMVVDGIKDF